ncbi:DMT family transporter [Luteipulveratus halotolerans]|uniref:EamA domain-containing protein n=1 Tax=Luteipulveratus halotolerans TaxID=1631356 RepID=A0A0L6CEM3_9MICO|nr:DMT family transporter [Luteipulveratus halotolerans]KNX36331.1 hypothetical protein VV01_02960 [Luteipulveratus halotolerans]
MSHQALALVLVAALCHALWNIAAKYVDGDRFVFVWLYEALSTVLWLPVGVVLLLRTDRPWSWALLIASVGSAVLHIAYNLLLQTGYDRAPLGVVYPVARGTGPLLSMLVAIALLGERPGWHPALGGLAVVIGVAVVATRGFGRAGTLSRPGLTYGLATGATIAAYTLWDGHAVDELALLPLPYFALTVLWQTVLMTPEVVRRRQRVAATVRGSWRPAAVTAVLSPVAYVLVLEAMRTTPVSLVAPARESSIIVGSLLAWWLFKEPGPVRRLTGCVVVIAGITLIAWG